MSQASHTNAFHLTRPLLGIVIKNQGFDMKLYPPSRVICREKKYTLYRYLHMGDEIIYCEAGVVLLFVFNLN